MTAFFIVDKRIPCRNVGRGFLIERSVPLPDNHALLDRHIHLAVGDVEGIEEILEVAQRSVHAPLTERVYVEFGQTGDLLVADVLCPDGRVAQVEALSRREAVDRFGLCLLYTSPSPRD